MKKTQMQKGEASEKRKPALRNKGIINMEKADKRKIVWLDVEPWHPCETSDTHFEWHSMVCEGLRQKDSDHKVPYPANKE